MYVTCMLHGMLCVRCYAALGDVAKARYLGKVIELVDKIEAETVSSIGSVKYCVHHHLLSRGRLMALNTIWFRQNWPSLENSSSKQKLYSWRG